MYFAAKIPSRSDAQKQNAKRLNLQSRCSVTNWLIHFFRLDVRIVDFQHKLGKFFNNSENFLSVNQIVFFIKTNAAQAIMLSAS